MFIFQNCSCCKSHCSECVPDYKPPATVSLSIFTGNPDIVGTHPAGLAGAIKSAVEMTLTLPLVNQQGYEFGYDKDTRAGNISYYLEFTPAGADRLFRASVIIPCQGLPRVGWDDFFSSPAASWTLTGFPDYLLTLAGWGKRTGGNNLDWNNTESSGESSPVLHQAALCSPPDLETTKVYWYGMESYLDGPSTHASIKKISTGVEGRVAFPDGAVGAVVFDDDYCMMRLTIGPSTPPPPRIIP
jgi:hypothetical protein